MPTHLRWVTMANQIPYGYYRATGVHHGYYGEPAMGYYGDQFDPVGYYADERPMGWYGRRTGHVWLC